MLSVVNQRMENFDARAKAETEATLSVIADAMTAEGIDSTATTTAHSSVPDKPVKSITDGKEAPSTVAVDEEHSGKKPLTEVKEVKAGEPSNDEVAELKTSDIPKSEEERLVFSADLIVMPFLSELFLSILFNSFCRTAFLTPCPSPLSPPYHLSALLVMQPSLQKLLKMRMQVRQLRVVLRLLLSVKYLLHPAVTKKESLAAICPLHHLMVLKRLLLL
jgi:hypothetical protein